MIGATPALLAKGIPDDAFKPIEGDDKKIAEGLRKRNARERAGQLSFTTEEYIWVSNASFAASLRDITTARSDTLRDVRLQSSRFRELEQSADYLHALNVSDAWCAAFVWPKVQGASTPVTEGVFRDLQNPGGGIPESTRDEIVRLAHQYEFFHWHLEFPEVFTIPEHGAAAASDADPGTGWTGGFSCVVGNPPWDKVDFEDKKYFSVVEPAIAAISGTSRRTRIAEWESENRKAGERYRAARRTVKSTFLFASSSGSFPLCANGLTVKGVNSLQADQLFAERFTSIVAPQGRLGAIIPTAVATGAGAQYLFNDFTQRGALSSFYDFENKKPLFDGVHSSYKFCLISLTGRGISEPTAKFAFFLHDTVDLEDADRVFALSPEEINFINPNTGTLPIFRSRRDADLTAAVYRRIPVLWDETRSDGNPWGIAFKRLFDMTDDSDLFHTRDSLLRDGWMLEGNVFVQDGQRMLPLYEGKMAHHFDHRWNSYFGTGNEDRRRLELTEKQDPTAVPEPRYWITENGKITTVRSRREVHVPGVSERLEGIQWFRDWLIGWRDVCRTTDERTAIPAFLPRVAVGHTYPLMLPRVAPKLAAAMVAAQSTLVFDFVSRQKISDAHMKLFIWKQLPVPAPSSLEIHTRFLTPRILELVYTAYDMEGLAHDLGDEGSPFRWDENRRAQLRAELDACFFHLYGISRDDADYILETFKTEPNGGLKNNEIAKYGEYRTKRLVLAEYDRMAEAGVSLENPLVDGENYTSTLTPPPGHGSRHPA
ncbi:hypothetical protein ACFQ0G_41455 [Streptomyces chiangmaiensis]